MNARMACVDLMKTGAILSMIVDHSASLEVGIDRDRADVLEAPLFQHQIPAEAALQIFQCQVLEHVPVVMHGHAPFGIVILPFSVIHISPTAMSHFLTPPSNGLKTKADSVLYFFIGEGILQNDGNPAFLVHVKRGIIAFLRKDILDHSAVHLHIDYFHILTR